MNDSKYYTIEEVANLLQIGKSSAYKLAHTKGVPAFKVGRLIRFDKNLFEKWCKKHIELYK